MRAGPALAFFAYLLPKLFVVSSSASLVVGASLFAFSSLRGGGSALAGDEPVADNESALAPRKR